MPCSTLLPYQNALTDPLMRCPIVLFPSTFDRPSPPSPATQQASRAHDKRDLCNTCIVSQLSRNKYCLNQRPALSIFVMKAVFDNQSSLKEIKQNK